MKVKELIEELLKYNQDAKVGIREGYVERYGWITEELTCEYIEGVGGTKDATIVILG